MNAYELADKLEWHWDNDCRSPAVSKSADMLRQQANRIAELEKELAFMEGEYPEPTIAAKIKEFSSLEQAYNKIVELEKRLERYQMALEHYKNKADYLDKRELELLAEIARLEKDLYMIQRHYDQLETFSPSGNNAGDVGNTEETLPKGKT